MASLIRGASLTSNTQQIAQLISQQQQSTVIRGQIGSSQQQTTQAQQLVHTFTPHVPRGMLD